MHNLLWLSVLSLAACGGGNNGSLGQKGVATFEWGPCLFDCGLDKHAMAAGGAAAVLRVTGAGALAKVESSKPEVATFLVSDPKTVNATAGQVGTADLILKDASGQEIDRATVTVKPINALPYDNGWGGDPGPTILANTGVSLHTIGKNGSEVLIGTGAVKFTLTGTLQQDSQIVFGDTIAFKGTVGTGSVKADCIDAHLTVPVAVVDSAAITSVELSKSSLTFAHDKPESVGVTTKVGDKVVFGAACTWSSSPNGLTFTGHAGFLGTAAVSYSVAGAEGSYTASCTAPGGVKSATLNVTIN